MGQPKYVPVNSCWAFSVVLFDGCPIFVTYVGTRLCSAKRGAQPDRQFPEDRFCFKCAVREQMGCTSLALWARKFVEVLVICFGLGPRFRLGLCTAIPVGYVSPRGRGPSFRRGRICARAVVASRRAHGTGLLSVSAMDGIVT